MSTLPSVNRGRGYEDQQQPNLPQVHTPAGRRSYDSTDSKSCCREIQFYAFAIAFLILFFGGAVFGLYNALLIVNPGGYEDQQQPNLPQVQTPAGRRSYDSTVSVSWREIQNFAGLLAFFYLFIGGTVLIIYSPLLLVNRGYEDEDEDEQQPNLPQVQTPAAAERRRSYDSTDSDSRCRREIQNCAFALAFFHLCVGVTLFFIYSTLLLGASSEIQVGQCELKQNTSKPEDHFDNLKNNEDYEGCLRDNDDKKKMHLVIYGVYVKFGLVSSFFMTVSSILLFIMAAKKNTQYFYVCHAFGWIPLICFAYLSGSLNAGNTYRICDSNVNINVHMAWSGYVITKIAELVISKSNKKLECLENNDDARIGVKTKTITTNNKNYIQ